jgi:predicted phosphodiesterase
MRLRILSDLHREFGPTELPPADADLIILAGDIATKQNALPWIREFCGTIPTAYVCGNHEFYGDKLPRVTERLIAATKGSNVHVLENDYFNLGDWHIYGCTLWSDLALHGEWTRGAAFASECMNDYKRIRNSTRGYRHLTTRDTRDIHLQSVVKLEAFLASHDPARTIMVTHHAPSLLSLPPDRRDKSLSCAYTSNLDDLILRHQPALWIHGHIHHQNDYRIGQTRILANPQGYPDEPNPEFIKEFVVHL